MSTNPQAPQQAGAETEGPAGTPYPGWYQKPYYDDPRRKSPALAALLSLMPGLGQIYVGYYQQGFINILVVASIIAYLASETLRNLVPLAGIFLAFYWCYNIIDAARRASLYNQLLAGLGPTQLPEETKGPGTKGSLFGGLVLMAFGLLMFAHTKFNFSLDWLEDWWPMVLVLAGGYLIYMWGREYAAKGNQPETPES